MAQLEVIKFRDLLSVTAIAGFVKGLSPTTIEIHGVDFSSAEQVRINEVPCPEFMIVSKTVIYAQLPSEVGSMSSIEVLSSRFTRNDNGSKMDFLLGAKTRKVDGILKLVQLFTKWVLQSPGSDIFNPSRGGGLQNLAGATVSSKDMQPIYGAITQAIGTTVGQIRSAQSGVSNLPLNERLLSAELIDINIYQAQMQANASVSVISAAGADAVASLIL